MDDEALAALGSAPLDWRWKGLPQAPGLTVGDLGAQRWSLLDGDLPLPVMVLREEAIAANIATMRAFCAAHDASLAPHGKTTMAPELFARQIEAGAWGITVATPVQARVCAAFGVPRVIVAREVVDPAGLAELAAVQLAGTEVLLFVDSVEGAARAAAAFDAGSPLACLVEVGMVEGRAGTRGHEAALAVARAIATEPSLALRGVAAWEGHIGGPDLDAAERRVDAYLGEVRAVAEALDGAGLFDDAAEVVMTAGGSAWFDRVAAILRPSLSRPVRLVLRSGCTVSHDDGLYAHLSPFARGTADGVLAPAIEVWGAVESLGEPGLAIVGFGKRDTAFDITMPIPRWIARGGVCRPAAGLEVVGLNDQHAFVRGDAVAELAIGDLLGCGISHPCTAFDKWRLVPVVGADHVVVGAVHTFF